MPLALLASSHLARVQDMLLPNAALYLCISICTSNHMFGRVTWDKLPECVFENFQIFKFSKIMRVIPKIDRTKHVITG